MLYFKGCEKTRNSVIDRYMLLIYKKTEIKKLFIYVQ